ncbi:putative transcriptional Coactivator p15 (PC4) [Lyophyllum shimeji]|uniref:Transcriptional Coactivator p15 (PC4) n=1 Tax=Lyophyllum shimeji TaxID=47721 RepID=A0A9P3PKB8_LYOSH|nr:putative transcriptional Coactivator p15 (PC4) [Lyophyllum shimeji]
MAKRKASSDEGEYDDSDYTGSATEEAPKSRRNQKKRAIKQESDSEGEDATVKEEDELVEDDAPLAKRPKTEPTEDTAAQKAAEQQDAVVVKTSPEGDKYMDLGKKKRATVRSFKGIPLIDIREFYGPDGDEKPGKKGISLTLEQWEALKNATGTLDELFATVKKKK